MPKPLEMTSLLAISRYDLYTLHVLVTQNISVVDVASGSIRDKLASLLEELGRPEPLPQKEAENPIVILNLMTENEDMSTIDHSTRKREFEVSQS